MDVGDTANMKNDGNYADMVMSNEQLFIIIIFIKWDTTACTIYCVLCIVYIVRYIFENINHSSSAFYLKAMFISDFSRSFVRLFSISRRYKHIHLLILNHFSLSKDWCQNSKYMHLYRSLVTNGCPFITFLILAGTINALSTTSNVHFECILWTHS